MDPVDILPVEVLDYIWSMLPLSDLLSSMAVCHSWRDSISECSEVWRPLCYVPKLIQSSTWYSVYLEEAKMKWPWKTGSFTKGMVIEDCQHFCCTDDFIYIINFESKLCKYNPTAKLIKEIKIPKECKQICAIKKDVALLCAHTEWNEIVIYNEELEEVTRFATNEEIVWTSGGRLWARSAGDNRLVNVYYTEDGNGEERHVEKLLIPVGTHLMPLNAGWCFLYQGVVSRLTGDYEEKIYKCDQTPMSRIFMTMFTDNKEFIVIIDKKIIAGKHTFCTVLIYHNGNRLHRADIPKQLRHWCFCGQYLVLASFKGISTINLYTGALNIGEESKGLNFNDYIYGIQNIFDHPKLAWIIIDHGSNFVVYDLEKDCNLIVVNCERNSNMIANSLNTLICVKNMFVYTLKGHRLMARKTMLK